MELLVGTYTAPFAGMTANGEGIYGVSFDRDTGAFGAPRLLTRCVNPSCIALTPDGATLFAGREVFAQDAPALVSFRVGPDGALTELSRMPLEGELPCHLAYDPEQGRLASAQYWTGDVAVCTVRTGQIQPPAALTRTGSGPNAARQEGPHAHFVAFTDNGTVLHLVDLGTDRVVSHRLDADQGATETATLAVPAGSGPRHMALSPDGRRAWLLCELDETLVSLRRDGLGWAVADVQPGFAAPQGEDGAAAAIRLSPDGRHLYLSGRRQSQIAVFALDDLPVPVETVESGGRTPRDILVTADGGWVIAANQNSGTLTSLWRDAATGRLTASGHHCDIPSPVALAER
ncbi:lactonase family protein [Rhodobacteraceae bacterium CCMM004]|nr:lactonase family protein [Rhodobacteraceae bacterium CCMM004]